MAAKLFRKILIANRGEIAVRIIRACREMGIGTVIVFSDVDRAALHVRMADEAYHIGPALARDSYLNIGKVLDAALRSGAEAVHPGYGFLSENPEFARACGDARLKFIGPPADAMEMMGSKTRARQAMDRAGVPRVPGSTSALSSLDEAHAVAASIGYPILLKAAAGGGGKGMRLVQRKEDLASAFEGAQSEAQRSFKSGELYIEKLIINPIEVMTGMARRFGEGDWSARVSRSRLPLEFMPLARAFNAMAAQLSQRERELVATNDRLTVMASIDMLSGLANRRGFQSRLDFEWMKAQQYHCELSLLMIDVDHFKLYNDTYGHPEGDACLTRIGETLAGIAGETLGFAGRYGGEEFCLLLPNTSPQRALEIGETVRATVQDLGLPHITSSHCTVTVSVGVAATLPSDAQTPGDLIEAADAALYAAKHRGRNTVVEHGFAKLVDEAGMALAG